MKEETAAARQEFSREHDGLRGFHDDDKQKIMEWLGVGEEKTELNQAMGIGLLSLTERFYEDSTQGLPREEVMLLTCLLNRGVWWKELKAGEIDQVKLRLTDKLGGQDKAEAIFASGMKSTDSANPSAPWKLGMWEEMEAPIGNEVEVAVDEFLAKRKVPAAAEVPAPEPVPAGSEWNDDRRQQAQNFYDKGLNRKQRNRLDICIASLELQSYGELSQEDLATIMVIIPEIRRTLEFWGVKSGKQFEKDLFSKTSLLLKARGKESLDKYAGVVTSLLSLRDLPKRKNNQETIKAAGDNVEFFRNVSDAIRLRLEQIPEEKKEERAAADKIERVKTRLNQLQLVAVKSEGGEESPAVISEAVADLLSAANDLKIPLPGESLVAAVSDGKIGTVNLNLVGRYSGIEVDEFKGDLAGRIASFRYKRDWGLPSEYSVKGVGALGAAIYKGEQPVVTFGESGDLLTMQWETGVGLEEGLLVTALVAREFDPEFPVLQLDLPAAAEGQPKEQGKKVELTPEPTPPDTSKPFTAQEARALLENHDLLNWERQQEIRDYFEDQPELANAFLTAVILDIAGPDPQIKVDYVLKKEIGRSAEEAFDAVAQVLPLGIIDTVRSMETIIDKGTPDNKNIFYLYALKYYMAANHLKADSSGSINEAQLMRQLEPLARFFPDNTNADNILAEIVEFNAQVRNILNELSKPVEFFQVPVDLPDWLRKNNPESTADTAPPVLADTPEWLKALKEATGEEKKDLDDEFGAI